MDNVNIIPCTETSVTFQVSKVVFHNRNLHLPQGNGGGSLTVGERKIVMVGRVPGGWDGLS